MLDVKHAATVALSSALTAWKNGCPPLPDSIQEIRLAHSLLTQGEPTADELRPFQGERWGIQRRCDQRRKPPDTNAVTETDYAVAQIRALAARLGILEGFVAARVRPISRSTQRTSRR
jgi:hypothetical protein